MRARARLAVIAVFVCFVAESNAADCNRRRRGYYANSACPTDAALVSNPCGSGYCCPSLCSKKSTSYGDCCLTDRCGTKDDCEQSSIIGTIFSILFCFCCYGGIGLGAYFCMRAGQQPPAIMQPTIVMQQNNRPGGYPGQGPYAGHSQYPGAVQGMAMHDLHAMHAPPPGYTAQPANLGQTSDGWSKTTDPSGRVYEYNPTTHETRWPDEQPAAATATATATATPAAPASGGGQWQQAQDASGNTYEYNTATNATRWPQR